MWIWYSILFIGACQLAYSSADQEVREVNVEILGEKLANHLVATLKKKFGENWQEKVPELVEKLKDLAQKLEKEEKITDDVIPPYTPELMLSKWKKVFHKVGHFAGKVAESAATHLVIANA